MNENLKKDKLEYNLTIKEAFSMMINDKNCVCQCEENDSWVYVIRGGILKAATVGYYKQSKNECKFWECRMTVDLLSSKWKVFEL